MEKKCQKSIELTESKMKKLNHPLPLPIVWKWTTESVHKNDEKMSEIIGIDRK